MIDAGQLAVRNRSHIAGSVGVRPARLAGDPGVFPLGLAGRSGLAGPGAMSSTQLFKDRNFLAVIGDEVPSL